LRLKAGHEASAYCYLGTWVGVSQFSFIMIGTFHYLSWDIMEPIAYLMMFGNFNCAWLFYMLNDRDLQSNSIHEVIANRAFFRMCLEQGIDIIQHQAMLKEIDAIKEALY